MSEVPLLGLGFEGSGFRVVGLGIVFVLLGVSFSSRNLVHILSVEEFRGFRGSSHIRKRPPPRTTIGP